MIARLVLQVHRHPDGAARRRPAPTLPPLAPNLQAMVSSTGITPEELRTAAEAGTTFAELAEQNDVSQDELVDALVTAQRPAWTRRSAAAG